MLNKILQIVVITWVTWTAAYAASIKDMQSTITEALNISAANLEIDNLQGIATYTGDVNVDLGSRTLQCDKLVLYRGASGDLGKIVAYGSPVGYAGHVSDNPEIIHAYSDVMEYDLEKEIFYMRGNARVEQGKNIYEAPEIQYDVENEIITSSPSSQGRIHMVIDAESLQGL